MGRGLLVHFQTPTSRSPAVPNPAAPSMHAPTRLPLSSGPPPGERSQRNAPRALPRAPKPALPGRQRHPTFHGDRGDAPPARELRAAEEVRAEQRSLRAHGSRAARRPSALEPSLAAAAGPRSPLRALCRGAAARAAHPGREAPRPPAPLPLARRGASAAASAPLSRPPAPAPPSGRRSPLPSHFLAFSLSAFALRGSRFFPLDQQRNEVGGKFLAAVK